METLGQRLKKAMFEKGLSQQELSKLSGISQSSISNVVSGSTTETRKLSIFAKTLGVSVDWLATGKGSMDSELLPELNQKKDMVRIPIYGGVSASAGGGRYNTQVEQITGYLTENINFYDLSTLPKCKKPAIIYAIGDSMLPTIKSGEMLYVDMSINNFVNNAIYIIDLSNSLFVKRLQQLASGEIRIISDNDNYDNEDVYKEDLIVLGKLVSTFRIKNFI